MRYKKEESYKITSKSSNLLISEDGKHLICNSKNLPFTICSFDNQIYRVFSPIKLKSGKGYAKFLKRNTSHLIGNTELTRFIYIFKKSIPKIQIYSPEERRNVIEQSYNHFTLSILNSKFNSIKTIIPYVAYLNDGLENILK